MGPVIQFFKEEWGVISGAPVTFGLACLVVAAIAFLLARWLYRHQVGNAKSEAESAAAHIKLLESQLKQLGEEPAPIKTTTLNVV